MNWYISLGIKKENLKFRDHAPDERAHYALMATDIEYKSPFGWQELMGIHHRGDWDLKRHQQFSGEDMAYSDPQTGTKYLPWDIETSAGLDRSLLFLFIDAYCEEENPAKNGASRVVLKLNPKLAPYKVAVFPLLSNKPGLVKLAKKIYDDLRSHFMTAWDDRGNIGKRYYSQDELGTPYCVTADFDSLEDKKVTIRNRDTMRQERVDIKNLEEYLRKKLNV